MLPRADVLQLPISISGCKQRVEEEHEIIACILRNPLEREVYFQSDIDGRADVIVDMEAHLPGFRSVYVSHGVAVMPPQAEPKVAVEA